MGADLLLYVIPLVAEPQWDAGFARIAEVCDPEHVEHVALDNAGLDPDEPAEAKQQLDRALDDLRLTVLEGGRRDVVTLTLRGHDYLFTGGMSFGDKPTDFAEIVDRLGCTGVLDACGFTEADTNAVTLRFDSPDEEAKKRLEELRQVLRAERISWGELHELQGLAEHIDPGDVELLEAAGVPEFPEES